MTTLCEAYNDWVAEAGATARAVEALARRLRHLAQAADVVRIAAANQTDVKRLINDFNMGAPPLICSALSESGLNFGSCAYAAIDRRHLGALLPPLSLVVTLAAEKDQRQCLPA